MPDYLLTGPAGQRFNLSVPEGTDPSTIHETLGPLLDSLGPPQRQSRGEILQHGLESTRDYLTPDYLKDRPGSPMPPEGTPPGKIGPESGPPTTLEKIGGLAGDVAMNVAPELKGVGAAMKALPAGMGRFASPRQIRSHLDELSTALREGRITQEQFGQARERLGLPREAPEYLRPRLVTPERQPGLRPRSVNPQTLSELRSISDEPTEQQMVARAARGPSPQRSEPAREGILGGDRQARDLFHATIAPHQDEATFAQSYFNGAYSPSIRFRQKHSDSGPALDFDGDLVLNGDRLGSIHRVIYPEAGYAYNAWLGLKPTLQAGGFTKGLMANQFDLYRKMGLERVNVLASVSLGGYSWAKYGFLPTEPAWRALKDPVGLRLTSMRRLMSPEDFDTANTLLSSPDPRAIWAISDMFNPIEHPSLKNPTVGKALLAGMDWHGEFRFDNPKQNVRFDRYVAKRQ